MLFKPCLQPSLKRKKYIAALTNMSDKELVIDIERNENVTIEVNVNDSPVAVESVTEENVFVRWKRIVIGVSLIMFMIIPLAGGTLISYFLRKDLHEPVDPYNVWPNTIYSDQESPEYLFTEDDKGFSSRPNHYLLIKNGKNNHFTISTKTNADMYMSVYMLENLYGQTDDYTIHVVTSTRKSNLSPVHDITLLGHHMYLEYTAKMENYFNNSTMNYEYYEYPSICLAAKIAERFPATSSATSTDQSQIMNNIAAEINKAIKANISDFYYPSADKTGSYIFAYHGKGGVKLGMFEDLKNLRKEKQIEDQQNKASEDKSSKTTKIMEKPKYNKIEMLTLKELSG
jgi:hypothetical protein